MKTIILSNLVLLLVTISSAPAATRLVPDEYGTIQAAIDAAIDGDVVILAPITYIGYGNRDIDFLGKAITVRSVDPNDPDTVAATIIDCDGTLEEPHRGFYFHSGEDSNSVLSGLTITKGYAGYGGGIYCVSSHPTITNCTILNNMAKYWWDPWEQFSALPPNENSSTKVDNDGEVHINIPPPIPEWRGYGGGICCSSSNPTLTNCKFIGNWAHERGGGMYNTGSSPILTNCTFVSNWASFGGAMRNISGSPLLTNCIFISNSASFGGAMRNSSSSPRLFNCIFKGNSAGNEGGCIDNYGCNPMLTNCTFNKNSSINDGGVIYNLGSDATLRNCILWGNTAKRGNEIFLKTYADIWGNRTPSEISVDYSDVGGGAEGVYVDAGCTLNWGEGNIDADPCFVSPGYWDSNGVWFEEDYHLLFTSPCIDAGGPDYVPSPGEKDIDGEPRVIGGRVDMGVDEFTSTLTTILRVSPTEFQYSSYENGPNPKEQIMSIRNIGSGTLNWEITGDCPWLDVYPSSGESTGQMNEVTLSADISGMAPDSYECLLTIDADDALNSPQIVTVTLKLGGSELFVPSEYDTIQAAIDAAIEWDTVIVADGTYTGTGNRDIDFRGKEITVRSENGPENCIIDCNGTEDNPHRGFYFHGGEDTNSVLSGFMITNGYASYGGGIYCENSNPTIMNCAFQNNKAQDYEYTSTLPSLETRPHTMCPYPPTQRRGSGGGICCIASNATLVNCKFNSNSAYDEGGGMQSRGGSPKLINCTFSENFAGGGAGMSNLEGSSPTLTSCTFSENSAEYGGGGMRNSYNSNPTLTNCMFRNNSAAWSGGLGNYYSDPTLTNCTFSGNSADTDGGAINNDMSNPILTNCIFSGNESYKRGGAIYNGLYNGIFISNCTFTGNRAGEAGGGIYITPPPVPAGASEVTSYYVINTITNCIFWDNLPEQIVNWNSPLPWITYCDIQGGRSGVFEPHGAPSCWGEGNTDADPCFFQPGYWDANNTPDDTKDDFWIDGDYHLLPYSVCVDAGDPNYPYDPNETDLDNRPRVLDGNRDGIPVVDMGAYEFTSIPAEVRITPRTINLASKSKWLTCYIWLPDDYSVANIDSNVIFLFGKIQAESVQVSEKQQVAIAEFRCEEVQTIINIGEAELSIIGQLTDRTIFQGTDVIRVIDEGGGKPDKYVQAGNPVPADGAKHVSITADLSWTAGSYVTSHDVYFGTSITPPFVCNQTDTIYDPGTMDYGTTYYWRIDEINKWGKTTGQLWNFTTKAKPPPPPPLP